MKPISEMPAETALRIRGVFLDIDETLTTAGRLTAEAYTALESLKSAGLVVAPVTGRPAGWCDHIARMWPVDGVVGENGAFYFRYDPGQRRMQRRYLLSDAERQSNRDRLEKVKHSILSQVPGAAVAADQPYREADLAIDFCEDVAPLCEDAVQRIVALFEQAGATAKVSSIHVNGWFGVYDKLTMTCTFMRECFGVDLGASREDFTFIGDSPNDSPMFEYFPNSIGVANVARFAGRLSAEPAFVTEAPSGGGFAEAAARLLSARG
ncbi:MAG TPA: HAD-IIB family hydrolase [Gammaproteobacteria bacterium]|nr:HAD-IIB family hydrolase [Gammaproteobacteria bacterium]